MSLFEILKKIINYPTKENKFSKKGQMYFSNSVSETGPKLPCDLFYGEIILLNWLNGKNLTPTFPIYFTSYGINPMISFQKIKNMNLIKISSSFEGLFALKNKDLQSILRNHNLKVSGNKVELIERITNNIDKSQLNYKIPQVYVLTDLGKTIIKKYNIFIWAHKHASYGENIISPIDFIDSWELNDTPENIAFHIVNNKLNNAINYKSEDYYSFSIMEDLLQKYATDNNDQYKFNELCLNFLESFNLIENHQFIVKPLNQSSYMIQNEIINFTQSIHLNNEDLDCMVNNFINKYQFYFYNMNLNKIILKRMFKIALEKSIEEFHSYRLNSLLLMSQN